MKERLQKHLARAGLGSRRYCETLIEQGRVAVNGTVVDRVGFQVDPEVDAIAVDGDSVTPESLVYYLLHKPKGFVCSNRPQGNSRSALDLVRGRRNERLFCVGRLDEQSQGALLLTNDGEFSNRVIHPRYGVEKTYLVCVKGKPETAMLDKIRKGVHLAEGKTAPAKVHVVKRSRSHSLLKITLHEGKNRHLRRVFARIGLPVTEIIRLQIGSLSLGPMKAGQYRELKPAEISALLEEAAPGGRETRTFEARAPRPATRSDRPGRASDPEGGLDLPRPKPSFRPAGRPAGRPASRPVGHSLGARPATRPGARPATRGAFGSPDRGGRPMRGGRPAPFKSNGRGPSKRDTNTGNGGRSDRKGGPRPRKNSAPFPSDPIDSAEDQDGLFEGFDGFLGPDSETEE